MQEKHLLRLRLIAASLFCIGLAPGFTDPITHLAHMKELSEIIPSYAADDIINLIGSDEHITVKALTIMGSTLTSKQLVEGLQKTKEDEKGLLSKMAMNARRITPEQCGALTF